nr:hypothetical protein [Tanacetum cinerariifolium]
MDGWKPRALKNKSFDEIKELFDKAMEIINSFVDFRTELVEESAKKDKAVTVQESSSKRAGDDLDQERSKKQKIKDENESAKLKRCLEIVPDDVTIDVIPLSSKSPTIGLFVFGYGKRFFSQKGSVGGKGVKEKRQGDGVAPSGMGDAHISNTVDDVVKDSDGVNSSPTKVTLENSAVNKEDNLHDENDGLKNKGRNRVDVVVPVESIGLLIQHGFFLGKREAYLVVANYVRNTWDVNLLKEDVGNVSVWFKLHGVPVIAFSKDGLSAIATKIGTPLMLESYTSDMCIQSWGRSSYARGLIEVQADVKLKDNIVTAMPKIVMDAPIIPVFADSCEGNFRDAVNIGVDVVHPVPIAAVAFLAVTIVTTLAYHGETIRGIHEHLQGVSIEEDMSTWRFRMGMAKAENASLHGKIRTMKAIKTVTHSQERKARKEME